MRELKFRAWNTVSGEWVEAIHIRGEKKNREFNIYSFPITPAKIRNNIIVEQYTGLKDKNGKEIYEGDVLESTWNGDRAVVIWNDVEGEWEHYAEFNTHSKYSGSVIIGNIHENPELLKEDYKPAEPLIKDEKIRKAVRAWAEVNNIDEVSHDACWNAFRCHDFVIGFDYDFDRHDGLKDGKNYSIAELCGEEEE